MPQQGAQGGPPVLKNKWETWAMGFNTLHPGERAALVLHRLHPGLRGDSNLGSFPSVSGWMWCLWKIPRCWAATKGETTEGAAPHSQASPRRPQLVQPLTHAHPFFPKGWWGDTEGPGHPRPAPTRPWALTLWRGPPSPSCPSCCQPAFSAWAMSSLPLLLCRRTFPASVQGLQTRGYHMTACSLSLLLPHSFSCFLHPALGPAHCRSYTQRGQSLWPLAAVTPARFFPLWMSLPAGPRLTGSLRGHCSIALAGALADSHSLPPPPRGCSLHPRLS